MAGGSAAKPRFLTRQSELRSRTFVVQSSFKIPQTRATSALGGKHSRPWAHANAVQEDATGCRQDRPAAKLSHAGAKPGAKSPRHTSPLSPALMQEATKSLSQR